MSVFVVVLLAMGYLVYNNFLAKPAPPPGMGVAPGTEGVPSAGGEGLPPSTPTPGDTQAAVPSPSGGAVSSPKLKTDLLKDPRFSDLVIFGDLPIEVGEVGRPNPFIPYEGYESGGSEGE